MINTNDLKEYLSVLGLDKEEIIDEAKLKKAYIKASKMYHPDVCDEKYKDGLMFKKVNLANTYIKENMAEINDYLKNPSKYSYSYNTNYQYANNNYNQTYYYSNVDDLFRQFFNRSYTHEYTKEEMEQIKKERKRKRIKTKIYSSIFLAFGILVSFVSPFLSLPIIVLSLSSLLFS